MGFFRGTAAKGAATVEGIPVPPFERPQQKRDFITALQMYVAHLNEGELPELSQYALNAALEAESLSIAAADKKEFDPYPSTTVFAVACAVRFPAPWTPEGFATVINALGPNAGHPEKFREISAGRLVQGIDPIVTCQRSGDRGWTVTVSERGKSVIAERPADDFAMVVYLMGAASGYPAPYYGRYNERIATDLRAPAHAVVGEWNKYAKAPYLKEWFTEWPRPS